MHVIDAIGVGTPKNMSSIARELSVTVGTLTIAMNSLVKKGYVVRERSSEDRRVVYISLSEKGKKAYEHHASFHRQMIQGVMEELDGKELEVLVKTLKMCIRDRLRLLRKISFQALPVKYRNK